MISVWFKSPLEYDHSFLQMTCVYSLELFLRWTIWPTGLLIWLDLKLVFKIHRLKMLRKMNTLPWRCTESYRNWEKRNPSNLERWGCFETVTSWCTLGRLRDFRDTSWPSTLETRQWQSLSMKSWESPNKSRWSFIPTNQTMPPLSFPFPVITLWMHIMLLLYSMNEITIYYYSMFAIGSSDRMHFNLHIFNNYA